MSKEKQKGFLRYCTVVKILVRSNNFAGADWIFFIAQYQKYFSAS